MKQTLSLSSVTSADVDAKEYVTYNHKTESVDILANTFNVLKGLYFFREENLNVDDSNSESGIHERTCFWDLPVDIQIYILSFLDLKSLCRASSVCKSWSENANDELLWEKKLNVDSMNWDNIDHLSHPKLYRVTNQELSSKDIYLKCCPECRLSATRAKFALPKHMSKLRFYFGFSTPRIAMFGSGVDSTSFVKDLISKETSPFKIKGMFPGQDGVGSGVTLEYAAQEVNFMTLHGLTKAERLRQDPEGERRSRLFFYNDLGEISLVQSVKELIKTVDALIYVVNTSTDWKDTYGRKEFLAMTDKRWVSLQVPVLVLCISPDDTRKLTPPLYVADKLDLLSLSRPWQVRLCDIANFKGLLSGMTWLNKQIMGL